MQILCNESTLVRQITGFNFRIVHMLKTFNMLVSADLSSMTLQGISRIPGKGSDEVRRKTLDRAFLSLDVT